MSTDSQSARIKRSKQYRLGYIPFLLMLCAGVYVYGISNAILAAKFLGRFAIGGIITIAHVELFNASNLVLRFFKFFTTIGYAVTISLFIALCLWAYDVHTMLLVVYDIIDEVIFSWFTAGLLAVAIPVLFARPSVST